MPGDITGDLTLRDMPSRFLTVNYVTTASGSVGTSAVELATILAVQQGQQSVLITNTHASNTLYVGFSSGVSSSFYSYKLASGSQIAIQVGKDVLIYLVASGSSTTVAVVRGT